MVKDVDWLLKLYRLMFRVVKLAERLSGIQRTVYVWSRVPFYKKMWEEAAIQLNAQFKCLAEGVWEIRDKECFTWINLHQVQFDDVVIWRLTGNKAFCYNLMKSNGLSVANYLVFGYDQISKILEFMKGYEGFYVVKPSVGTSAGVGVTTHIRSSAECRRAVALASLYGKEIIIERLVPGECYRLLILNGKMIHAVRRRGVRVNGDGRSTISQLIDKGNSARKKNFENSVPLTAITVDRDVLATLQMQNLSMIYVPAKDEEILIKSYDAPVRRNHVEVRTVYNENVTDLICKDVQDQAERAAKLLNARFAGVDIITHDPTIPLRESGGVINEINSSPGLHHHYNLMNDEGSSPATVVLKELLRSRRRI